MNKIIFSLGEIKGNERQFRASLLLLHQIPQPQADKTRLCVSLETLTTMMLPAICSDFWNHYDHYLNEFVMEGRARGETATCAFIKPEEVSYGRQ